MPLRRLFLLAIALASISVGCTRTLRIELIAQPDRGSATLRTETCDAPLYAESEPLAASCTEVGDLFVGDTGWTFDCGAERVRAEVRRQTCLFGADAAQIIREQEPSWTDSSCDQIRARFLRCAEGTQ